MDSHNGAADEITCHRWLAAAHGPEIVLTQHNLEPMHNDNDCNKGGNTRNDAISDARFVLNSQALSARGTEALSLDLCLSHNAFSACKELDWYLIKAVPAFVLHFMGWEKSQMDCFIRFTMHVKSRCLQGNVKFIIIFHIRSHWHRLTFAACTNIHPADRKSAESHCDPAWFAESTHVQQNNGVIFWHNNVAFKLSRWLCSC